MCAAIPLLGERFEKALTYAAALHRKQLRRGTTIPYVSHLMLVCALVLEQGGGENQAIAALLHDAVEDQGGQPRLEEIRGLFGDQVASLVKACTDADTTPKPPWKSRKQAYIDHLATVPPETLSIILADKIHNAGAILRDYRECGDEVWRRFHGTKEEILWYYRALHKTLRSLTSGWALDEFTRIVNELEKSAAESSPS